MITGIVLVVIWLVVIAATSYLLWPKPEAPSPYDREHTS